MDKYEDMMREKSILEKHEKKVKEETEGDMVKKLLEDGFTVDDVLKYTSLKKSQVIALSNAIVLK